MNAENVDDQADDVYNGILGEIGLEYSVQDPVSIRLQNNHQYRHV